MFYQHFGEDWMQLTLDLDGWNESFASWLVWRKGVFNKQRRGQRDNKFSFISALEGLVINEREKSEASCAGSDSSTSSS